HRPLLRVGGGNLALLGRGMLFLDDAERQFAEVPQLDLFLLVEARCQFARVEGGDAQEPDEAEADERIDPSTDRHLQPTNHCKRHARSPREIGATPTHRTESYMPGACFALISTQ